MDSQNKTKVAHILHSVGGVDVSLRLILENINPSSFENIVIHGLDDTKKKFKDSKNETITEYKLTLQRNINIFKDLKAIFKSIKILKQFRPEIIHAHSAKGGIIGKIVGKYLNIPVLHTPQAYSYLSANSKFKRKLYLSIEKFFTFKGNMILASSNSEKNRAINEVNYPEKRVLLFNNSILPINESNSLSIKKTWPDEYICSVGRPSYQKNIELMLDVLFEIKKQKPSIHLVLMGVGYHSPNLAIVDKKIKDLNLQSNITLLEWTERKDIFYIIKNSILYFSSARYEGLPYSIIESLALGKPVVATNADGNRDLIVQNYNGFIIKNENITDLCNSVLRIIDDINLRQKFSGNSIKLFHEHFNMEQNIKDLENIYLISKKK